MNGAVVCLGAGVAVYNGVSLWRLWRAERRLQLAATTQQLKLPPPRDPGPFRTPGVLLPQPSLTVVREDFRAEVINGWLLVRIKLPAACAACGAALEKARK